MQSSLCLDLWQSKRVYKELMGCKSIKKLQATTCTKASRLRHSQQKVYKNVVSGIIASLLFIPLGLQITPYSLQVC